MIDSTGRHILNNVTETGLYASTVCTEAGNQIPISKTIVAFMMKCGFIVGGKFAPQTASKFTMSGGGLFGGNSAFNTVTNYSMLGGGVFGGPPCKIQIPYAITASPINTFSLIDASLIFKLEQQP